MKTRIRSPKLLALAMAVGMMAAGWAIWGARPAAAIISRGHGYGLYLTETETVLKLRDESSALRMKLLGANPRPQVTGADQLPGKTNYFIGNDPKKWRKDIPTYAKVKYEAVYPGVDVVYYGAQGRELEYDFIVAPGADPKAIKLSFEGADKLELNEQGDLVLRLSGKPIHLRKPVVYQEKDGGGQRARLLDLSRRQR